MTVRSHDSWADFPRTVHVVTTCTDRKTRAPQARAGALALGELPERVAAWRAALTTPGSEPVPASTLYAGDHWQVAKALPSVAPGGITVRLWVCSAGYGLIEPETPLRPYAATFDTTHPDSVAPRRASFSTTAWWNALVEWDLGGSSIRSIAALASRAQSAGDLVLVAVSERYLAAIRADAAAAAEVLGDRLLLLSVGTRPDRLRALPDSGAVLARHLLPADASMKALVGGAMQSLNVRLARQALRVADQWIADPRVLHALSAQWGAEAPPTESYDRARSDDATLRDYVRAALGKDPNATHTSLLRTLRSSGCACEQSRFRALFHEVRDEIGLLARGCAPRGVPV